MSACLLLEQFQLYVEMSAGFGLSIYTATASSWTVGNENVLLEFFGDGGEGVSIKKVNLWLIAPRKK